MTSTPQRASSLLNGQQPHHHHPHPHSHPRSNGLFTSAGRHRPASMSRDPPPSAGTAAAATAGLGSAAAEEDEREDDPIHQLLKARFERSEATIAALFGSGAGTRRASAQANGLQQPQSSDNSAAAAGSLLRSSETAKTDPPPPVKKAARQIDEDDYGDDDEEDEEEEAEDDVTKETPLKAKGKAAAVAATNGAPPPSSSSSSSLAVRSPQPPGKSTANRTSTAPASDQAKSSEDVRKQLEEDKKAAAEAAKNSFQTMYHTFEYDRDAMLEQQKLDELDREVENEISGGANGAQNAQAGNAGGTAGTAGAVGAAAREGTLGSADLGASSLTLKHLIARIDMKRDMVKASDNQLRTLIAEVRKGRSKWASEEKVGQEELYEAAEKVLMELKAMTEYAQPFLQRVSKREAPDYANIIKFPMDIGSMLKKLKQLQYKSKKEFVDDLNLIWSNCLKYNQDPGHPVRKKALYMRKETDKLTPLIPEIVVRDRAEVEAEERRLHSLDAEDSDDDDAPIMASRSRKGMSKKGGKGPNAAKRAPPVAADETASTPAPEPKPALHASATNLRNDFLRADSEIHDPTSTGFNTPPPGGTSTPSGVNGVQGSGAHGSQVDATEVDGVGHSMLGSTQEDADEDDTDFKTWKQVTKKDRAQAAAERNRLFRGEQLKNLNVEEPALLRTKAMMRRWVRQQKVNRSELKGPGGAAADLDAEQEADAEEPSAQGETLAEGIEKEEDSTLPDYYNPLSAIPDLDEKWRWVTDSEGEVVPQNEEWLRMYPRQQFQAVQGALTKKMDANLRQMQETRKIVSKIGVVKQMQIQAQTYQNQFTKYEPQPFVEPDVGPVVVSESGPIMAPFVVRSAFQRSVGKIFYHAGYEDFQPAALDTITDIAADYMSNLVETFKTYREEPKRESGQSRFTFEEQVLHTLHEYGHNLEDFETYFKDDVERQGTKLSVVHDRMRSHLADLLRPALGDHAGADGVGAFNDGSEQFVGGDFAEDLGEDFFGFKELGLDEELGMENLSVPLHLLQNRMHSAYQAQNSGPVSNTGVTFPNPAPYDQLTSENLQHQIGIVQDFFRAKLQNNRQEPLVEDEDLPQKQRFPKPRLPPTGKISSPRKRPLREQQQLAKKKRKLEESESQAKALQPPVGKLRLEAPGTTTSTTGNAGANGGTAAALASQENDNNNDNQELNGSGTANGGGEADKDGEATGPLSPPESVTAN